MILFDQLAVRKYIPLGFDSLMIVRLRANATPYEALRRVGIVLSRALEGDIVFPF